MALCLKALDTASTRPYNSVVAITHDLNGIEAS